MTSELKLASLIKTMTGVHIAPEKYYLFEHRFAGLMEDYAISNYSEMAEKIAERRDIRFIDRVIEQITTHETRFFRDEGVFKMIAGKIIPRWRAQRKNVTGFPQKLRIWSAACSTGQEIWSIAMLIAEHFPDLAEHCELLATDISSESLVRAKSGIYSPFEISRGMPPHLLLKYFNPEGASFRVRRTILPSVQFTPLNLLTDTFPHGTDIVLCRNVALYFSDADRATLFGRIRRQIALGGTLILGASESIEGNPESYRRHNEDGGVYYTFTPEAGIQTYYGFQKTVAQPD
jgi:chemotaxis protein methyltransferase CheR